MKLALGFTLAAALFPLVAAGSTWWRGYNSDPLGLEGIDAIATATDGGFYILLRDFALNVTPASARSGHGPRPEFLNQDCQPGQPFKITILRLDSAGVPVWMKRYGLSSTCTFGKDIRGTSDGGAVVIGDFNDSGSDYGARAGIAFRIDANGTIVWAERVRQPIGNVDLQTVIPTGDGGFFLRTGGGAAKLNSDGSGDWARNFVDESGRLTGGSGAAPLPDGGYAGLAFAPGGSALVRVDGGGRIIWSKQVSGVPDPPFSVSAIPGGGVLIDGGSYLARLASDGSMLWARFLGSGRLTTGSLLPESTIHPDGSISVAAGEVIQRFAASGEASAVALPSGFHAAASSAGTVGAAGEILAAFPPIGAVESFEVMRLDPNDLLLCPGTSSGSPGGSTLSPVLTPISIGVAAAALVIEPLALEGVCLPVTSSSLCAGVTSRGKGIGSTALTCAIAPSLQFEFTTPQSVLIHKYRDDDHNWLSPFQQRLDGDPAAGGSTDGKIDVRVRVVQGSVPIPGIPVYFRVTDPPDTAPYVVQNGDAASGDNRDPLKPLGSLLPLQACVGGSTCSISDSDGWARAVLTTTSQYAGDNYVIEASLDPSFTCGAGCAKSGVITAWKRIYVEAHTMLRRGAYIKKPAHKGDDEVVITIPPQAPGSPSVPFHSGQGVKFIHGEPYWHPAAPPGATLPSAAYSETKVLNFPNAEDPMPGVYQDSSGDWVLHLSQPLENDYDASTYPATFPFMADAVGADYFTPDGYYVADQALVPSHFATMFVDVQPAPSAFPDIPYDTNLGYQKVTMMSTRWFSSARRGATINDAVAAPNHMMLVGASFGMASGCSTNYGDTVVDLGNNRSFVYVGRIEQASSVARPLSGCSSSLPTFLRTVAMVNRGTTAHEMTHQWKVNHHAGANVDAAGNYTGHCVQAASGSADRCLMNVRYPPNNNPTQIETGRIGMHYLAHGNDSEYMDVRTQAEPVPQK